MSISTSGRHWMLASMAVVATTALVSVASSQIKHRPPIAEYAGSVTTTIALRDDSGAIKAHLTLQHQGSVSTYQVTDVSGNVYSAGGPARSGQTSGPPLASSSLGGRGKLDASDDVRALRKDLDNLNSTLNTVIARVNQLSTGQ